MTLLIFVDEENEELARYETVYIPQVGHEVCFTPVYYRITRVTVIFEYLEAPYYRIVVVEA